MFSNPFPNAFGLDISDLSLKVVQLRNVSHRRVSPSYKPIIHRSMDLPHGLIVNGEIQEPETVRKHIKRLIQGNKNGWKPIKGSWVVSSLPETQSFIKHLTLNKSADALIEEDVHRVAKKHIPFDEDSYYIDWQIIPSSKEGSNITDVIIGAVSKNIANSYTYLLKSLGLGVIALEIEALSIARAMITASKEYENEARGLLDLGATRSSFIVYDYDAIQFSIDLPFSGEIITTALSQKLNISYAEAEKIKITSGLEAKNQKNKSLLIISNLVDELVEDVKKAIEFYYSHFSETNKITHITMSGGSANLKRIDKIISTKLKIESRPGNPWKNLASKKKIMIEPDISLGYATAIGLALRAADNPFFKHDII
ncbi:type IV pilus assembly protein PilM [Patescibacteria group bacterium]|nr:type IV pilus assembly protein PilM [Patescibacteria group bacterium]